MSRRRVRTTPAAPISAIQAIEHGHARPVRERLLPAAAAGRVERAERQVLDRSVDVEQTRTDPRAGSRRRRSRRACRPARRPGCARRARSRRPSGPRARSRGTARPAWWQRRRRGRLSASTIASHGIATAATTSRDRSAKPSATSVVAMLLAATTSSRRGAARKVGVIVPCLNSVVTIVIPRMSARRPERPTVPTRSVWNSSRCAFLARRRPDLSCSRDPGDQHDHDQVRPPAARRPDLEQLRADERGHSVVSPPVSSRKTSSSVALSTVSSWRTIPFAAASSPTCSGGRSTASAPSPSDVTAAPCPVRSSCSRLPQGSARG